MIPGFGLSKSISNTITASTGLAVLFAVVMMGGAVWYETRVLTQKTFERAGQIQTTFLSETLGGALRFGKVDALEASFASFKESVGESVEWIVVVNADGELVSQSDGTSVPLQSLDLKALAASATAAGAPQSDEGVIAAPVRFGPNKDVVGTVIVAYSNAQFARDLLGVLIHGAFVGLAVAVLAITMNILVLPRILRRPLEKLDVVLEKIGDGNLALEVPGQEKSNELGMIARRVEALRALLQQAEATRKGHEAAQRETQAARARMMDALDTGVGQVVAAARQGDFSQRVSQNFDDELIQSLATGVNLICEDVAAFLDETESATGGLAKGNTSLRMSETFSGRFAEVAAQLNAAMGTMSDLVGNLRDIDGEIRKTVGAVLDGSAEFSGQSESQAASLRQFAAVMNEISDSIDASAANAHQSSKKAGDANAMSRQGRDVCEEAISAMSAIQEHASKISEIVSVIDGIAFQTNLLALNAAVEAARAGESGKGFAVVASEVRTLAQRSADAARDISALIAESQAKVDNGAALVGRTGEFLSSISDGIKSVSTAVDEISGATRQQSQGIAEIKEEIKRIDQVSRNTASIAEKSAAQANDLNQKATNLSSLISYFKTKDGGNEPMLIAAE